MNCKILQTLRFSFKLIYFWFLLIHFLSIPSAHSIFLGQWFLCVLKFLNYLFIFGCAVSRLLCVGFSLVVVSRDYFLLRCAGFSWCGFSRCRAQGQGARASVVVHTGSAAAAAGPSGSASVGVALRRGCSVAHRLFLGAGFKRPSPALAVGFLTTRPSGRSCFFFFFF